MPASLAVDNSSNVYVTDIEYDRIQIFSKNGDFKNSVGNSGNGKEEFDSPSEYTTGCQR